MEQTMLDYHVKGLALDEQNQMPVVILQSMETKRTLPLSVGPFEASAIIIEMEGIHPPRPLTHDLFSELFQRHRFQMIAVEIYGRLEDEYLARIRYRTRIATHTMEVRPSDGIALALRLQAPILVDEQIARMSDADDFIVNPDTASHDVLYLETQKPGIQFM
jgi:uncharacterized protein